MQVAAITIRAKRGATYERLVVGNPLPFSVPGWPQHAASDRRSTGSSCHVAFICSTGCSACSALAERDAEEEGSNTSGLGLVWLLGGDSARVASWANRHGLRKERVLALTAKNTRFWQPPVPGDVWITPTRVVLTSELVVRDARPSDVVPSHEELKRLCNNGGIAPQGLGELRRLLGADG